MRQYRSLYMIDRDDDAGILNIYGDRGTHDYPAVAVRREGQYVQISVSYGPLEMALRLPAEDLERSLHRLVAIDGLRTTRKVGSSSAYIGFGLNKDGTLVMRPTVVADATGHLSFNFSLPTEARAVLFEWLELPTGEPTT